jgi:hypothetical protein
MRAMRTFVFVSALIVVALMAQNVAAMPSGAYVDDYGKEWEGYKTYQEDGFDMVLQWAVYDIADNPWAAEVEFPEGDNYIYAYQLFNKFSSSEDIGLFAILDISGNPLPQDIMHNTRSVADGDGAMSDPNPSDNEGEWEWSAGVGFVSVGRYSAFLVFSSPYGPTRGSFKVQAPEDEEGPGEPEVPEPGTIALLGGGAGLILLKRRTKR